MQATRYITPKLLTSETQIFASKRLMSDDLYQYQNKLVSKKRWPGPEEASRKRGTGLRSSFNGIVATVFNGSSFVAKSLVARLGKTGTQVIIAHRGSGYDEFRLRVAGDLGQIYFAQYDLKDDKSLHDAMQYSNVVINLVGKENETKNFTWEDVHVEGPRRMARIAKECGVDKFIHFSALNCHPDPEPKVLKTGSQFYRSKYYGELAVREEFPEAIIFRPSDIAGERDNFLNHFLAFQRSLYTPNLPLYDYYYGVVKQPVFIDDVIRGVELAISSDSANGKTFQMVGPYRYNFYELIKYMRDVSGNGIRERKFTKNLRFDIPMRVAIWFVERVSKYPFLTWERIERDLTTDFVDPKLPTLEYLGVELTPLELQLLVLSKFRPTSHRYDIPYTEAPYFEPPRRLNQMECMAG